MSAAISRRSFIESAGLAVLGSLAFPYRAIAQTSDIVVPSVSYGGASRLPQGRSWYSSSFLLNEQYTTNTYYYDGNSIGIELNATSTIVGSSFLVTLYQGSRSRGSTTLRANGFVRAEWNGVGPGSYKFVFRNISGQVISCANVAMFSW